jgi:hypothetical protein
MIPKDVKFKSLMNPALATFNGITYVVPGWHVVPTGTTLEEVQEHWEKEVYSESTDVNPKGEYERIVISKRTGEEYTVKFNGHFWSCTCTGFGYRGHCKHIEETKKLATYTE